jgi:sialic acid synthase
MVADLKRVPVVMGDGKKVVYEEEKRSLAKLGKKLVAARDLPADHTLTEEDIAVSRLVTANHLTR